MRNRTRHQSFSLYDYGVVVSPSHEQPSVSEFTTLDYPTERGHELNIMVVFLEFLFSLEYTVAESASPQLIITEQPNRIECGFREQTLTLACTQTFHFSMNSTIG
jgi:hypothetical protein